MKRRKHACIDCYNYNPHPHWERFEKKPPRTEGREFLFLCDFGDVSFASGGFMLALIGYCLNYYDRTFLIQSKQPSCFHKYIFTSNVILGTTIETNRDEIVKPITKAPVPSKRYRDMLKLRHPRKIVTIEPILDFDLYILTSWIEDITPECVYVGYDSHPEVNKLPEPPLSKVKQLVQSLAWKLDGLNVDDEIQSGVQIGRIRLKEIRKAWWE